MPDINIRSDSVNVEQIMDQIRARIREKRGVDYTEEQIRELAQVKLEKFLDPRGVRSDLLGQFRRTQKRYEAPELPKYSFEDETIYETHRGLLRRIRELLHPFLKMLFNPNPIIQALHIQSHLNKVNLQREVDLENSRRALEQLHYEVLHNLVIETTRLGIEVKNLKMRVESLTGRLDFNERRARALERAVAYQPASEGAAARPFQPPPRAPIATAPAPDRPRAIMPEAPAAVPSGEGTSAGSAEGPGQRSRRRRRRRGRRGGAPATAIMGGGAGVQAPSEPSGDSPSSDQGPTHEPDSTERAASSRPVPLIEHAMVNEVHPAEPFETPAEQPSPSPQHDSSDDGSDQS